ncbi:MAG: hypothetical protein RML40_05735 [Bacteroidota bacterium]|nr:hypothetical protein [Candidatus Kapabacteria bacterium]MDW8220014.1 hypothetical protein [Bacteroidota bacterium]
MTLAIGLILALHATFGWQWALAIPLLYALFFPDEAYVGAVLQMLIAWCILLIISYVSAPEETRRMWSIVMSILAGKSTQEMTWLLPLLPTASLIFAGCVGILSGMLGKNLRYLYQRAIRQYSHDVQADI